MMQHLLELTVDYTRRDYAEALREHNSYCPYTWGAIAKRLLSRLFDMAVIGLCLAIWYFFDNPTFALFGLGVVSIEIWRLVRRHFLVSTKTFERNPRWREIRRWVLSEDGIIIHSDSMDSRIKWSYLSQVLECKHSYLFFHGDSQDPDWFFVPKRVFESVTEENLLRTMLSQNSILNTARFNLLNYI